MTTIARRSLLVASRLFAQTKTGFDVLVIASSYSMKTTMKCMPLASKKV